MNTPLDLSTPERGPAGAREGGRGARLISHQVFRVVSCGVLCAEVAGVMSIHDNGGVSVAPGVCLEVRLEIIRIIRIGGFIAKVGMVVSAVESGRDRLSE